MIKKNILISFTIGSVIITGLIGLYKWKYNYSNNIIKNDKEKKENITNKEQEKDITNKEQEEVIEEDIINKD